MRNKLTIFFTLFSFIIFSQNSNQFFELNLKKYDKQWYHFGFTIGVAKSDFKIDYTDNFMNNVSYDENDIIGIESKSTPGFNVGIICDLKIFNNLNFRFIPSLTFTQRDLLFNTLNGVKTTQIVENSNLDLPILFKLRSNRFQNIRPYLIFGGKFTYDMASKEQVDDFSIFKLKKIDYGMEFGFGLDIYLAYFKLCPEIKYFYGINNMLVNSYLHTNSLSNNIDALYTRSILFSLTFE